MRLFPIIMAGGTGSRLWPVSRRDYPKQFLPLTASDLSLFQLTIKRLYATAELASVLAPPVIVTNDEYRFIVARGLDTLDLGRNKLGGNKLNDYAIILEPEAKNTAPAIALAANYLVNNYKGDTYKDADDDLMLVLPADAYIREPEKFISYVSLATSHWHDLHKAADDISTSPIGTFGVKPINPHTGYGYIQATDSMTDDKSVLKVNQFVEKPDFATATKYLKEGNYYWNSGIFMLNPASYIQRLHNSVPAMHKATEEAMAKAQVTDKFIAPDADAFATSPADSIDYAIMEKDDNIFVTPMDITWSDVGSWKSLADLYDKDEQGNSHKGNVVMQDTENSFVMAAGSRLVTTLGVKDIAVVDTPDALLVTSKDNNENVRDLVSNLSTAEKPQATEQYRSHRPWGWYESIIKGGSNNVAADDDKQGDKQVAPALFQVKRLAVYPDAKLSLQSHKCRAEHWVVVQGTALVTIDDTETELQANQSIYIPLGAKHRLANPGTELLVVIEVQSGSYLGEDDITRYEDIYSRK